MMVKHFRSVATALCAVCMIINPFADAWAATSAPNPADSYTTTTPIKHLVVIFQENISFDHYFAPIRMPPILSVNRNLSRYRTPRGRTTC